MRLRHISIAFRTNRRRKKTRSGVDKRMHRAMGVTSYSDGSDKSLPLFKVVVTVTTTFRSGSDKKDDSIHLNWVNILHQFGMNSSVQRLLHAAKCRNCHQINDTHQRYLDDWATGWRKLSRYTIIVLVIDYNTICYSFALVSRPVAAAVTFKPLYCITHRVYARSPINSKV